MSVCFVWPFRHNFRGNELNFCLFHNIHIKTSCKIHGFIKHDKYRVNFIRRFSRKKYLSSHRFKFGDLLGGWKLATNAKFQDNI